MLHQEKRKLRSQQQEAFRAVDLQRTFAVLSLVCIAAISTVTAVLLTRFLAAKLLERDAVANMEIIQAVADTENLQLLLDGSDRGIDEGPHSVPEFFVHVATMPDVFRVAIHGLDGTVIWSSDPRMIGRKFTENDDLDRAFTGELVYELSDRTKDDKPEYMYLSGEVTKFVENYIPVRDIERRRILGIVEIYKLPRAVHSGVAAGERLIWATSAAGAVFLYLTLYWIVRRAAVSMRAQQERLIEAETMAAVGEMASGIAHGIRNPLASIRTSAELVLEDVSPGDRGPSREAAQDVIAEVDRLENIIRELILMARSERAELSALSISGLAEGCVNGLQPVIERHGVTVSTEFENSMLPVLGDRPVLQLALNNVISNAVEAMSNGGTLAIAARMVDNGERVELTIADTGHGIPADRVAQVFKPFVTSKTRGLGLGLALTRRIVERHGGRIELTSEAGKGTIVKICLPAEAE